MDSAMPRMQPTPKCHQAKARIAIAAIQRRAFGQPGRSVRNVRRVSTGLGSRSNGAPPMKNGRCR